MTNRWNRVRLLGIPNIRKRPLNTYVYKALWRGTALLIKVEARTEAEAYLKALRRKDIAGCLELKLIEER